MTVTDEQLGARARALALAIEPFTGQVYFSPECHANYTALGFSPSPGTFGNNVHLPDGPAYFSSRGGVMGQVPGELVAAAFGVFNPDVVVPAVGYAWTLTDAATVSAARTDGAIGQLARLLGQEPDGLDRTIEQLHRAVEPLRPEGRPLFAGIRSRPLPEQPLGVAWQLADQLREFRGDAHINAWTSAGFDPVEIGLLTERYWGLPSRSYVRSRGWVDHHFDAAEERLHERGLFENRDLTEAGRAAREDVEVATDRQMRPVISAIGDDFDELVGTIGGWSRTIQAGSGYPQTGPHELAELAGGLRPRDA